MKTTCNILMALAVSGVMAAAAPPAAVQSAGPPAAPAGTNPVTPSVQVQSEITRPGMATNAVTNISLYQESPGEPSVKWGSKWEVTGLFVDLLQPEQTWALLNPREPARESSPATAPLIPPAAGHPTDDQGTHEANFTLLKLSFP
jgi:hypothetical protein